MDPSNIIRGTNGKPVASEGLEKLFIGKFDIIGRLYMGYPIVATPKGAFSVDALLVSPDKGVIIFDLIEGRPTPDYAARQDDAANKLEARLKTHEELMNRRNLSVPISVISFVPGEGDLTSVAQSEYPIVNNVGLESALAAISWDNSDDRIYLAALSAIQSISTVRHGSTPRTIRRQDSRGAKLKRLEDSIATLDNLQSKAVIETAETVQTLCSFWQLARNLHTAYPPPDPVRGHTE